MPLQVAGVLACHLPAMGGDTEKSAVCRLEEGSHQNVGMGQASWAQTASLQNMRNNLLLLISLPVSGTLLQPPEIRQSFSSPFSLQILFLFLLQCKIYLHFSCNTQMKEYI